MSRYYNDYAPGAFAGLAAGLRYLENQDSIHADRKMQTERLDALRQSEDKQLAYNREGLAEQGRQFDKTTETQRLEIDNNFKIALRNAGINEQDIQGRNVLRTAQAGEANARANQTNATTYWGNQQHENQTVAKVVAQLDQEIMANYGGDRKVAMQDPAFKKRVVEIHGSLPSYLKALNEETKMTVTANPLRQIGDEDAYALTGTSDIDGQQTVATSRPESVRQGSTAGAISEDSQTIWAQLDAKAYMGGYQGEATLSNLAAASEQYQMTPEQMADSNEVIRKLKENTAEAPTDEQVAARQRSGDVPGYTTPPGGRRSQFRDYPDQPGRIGQPGQVGPSPEPDPTGPSPLRRQLSGVNALYGSNPDVLADTVQGRGIGKSEADHNRTLEGNVQKAELSVAEANARADIEDPNRDVKAADERTELLNASLSKVMRQGMEQAFTTFDFTKEIGFFDKAAETWLGEGLTPQQRQEYAMEDVLSTFNQPENRAMAEEAIQVPYDQWGVKEWKQATEMVKLSREGDERDNFLGVDWLGADVKTFGKLDPEAVKKASKGLRLNTRAN